MTVNVDVFGPGMPCLAARCSNPAQFFVHRDELPKMHYCGPDDVKRIWFYQRQNRQIVVSPDEGGEVGCIPQAPDGPALPRTSRRTALLHSGAVRAHPDSRRLGVRRGTCAEQPRREALRRSR